MIENYDYIKERVKANTKDTIDLYNNLMNEYETMLKYFDKISFVLK